MLFCSVISKAGQVALHNPIVEEAIDDRTKSVTAVVTEDIGGMYALNWAIISLPGRSPGRATVLPLALAASVAVALAKC